MTCLHMDLLCYIVCSCVFTWIVTFEGIGYLPGCVPPKDGAGYKFTGKRRSKKVGDL